MNIFEQAARQKYRFQAKNDFLMSAEDLFDLPLKSRNGMDLDTVAKNIHRQIRDETEESFVSERSKSSADLEAKFEIVKFIIEDKKAQAQAAEARAAKRTQVAQIDRLIEQKKNQELEGKSLEELEAMKKSL